MKTVDLLQVVYEHWAKPRDIEEKKILKSSIGSPLPTCLHCVICKSNNLTKSLFFFLLPLLSLESVCLSDCRRIVSQNECIQDVREPRSFMAKRGFFSFFLRYTFMWKLGQIGQICFYRVACFRGHHNLYFIDLPPQCHWWEVASFFKLFFLCVSNKKGIFERCNLPLKISFLLALRLQI